MKIQAGLGNQMFQYALARHLSIKNHVPFKFDTTSFAYDPFDRIYTLGYFNIVEEIASPKEIDFVIRKKGLKRTLYQSIEKRVRPFHKRTFVKERYRGFDPDIFNLSFNKDLYFDGGWQSEFYFKDIQDILRKEFTVRNPPQGKNESVLHQIQNHESVCLHVRRTDYVTHPVSKNKHGGLSMAYYTQAASIIADKVKDPYFYIFSDDPEWVQKYIKLPYPFMYVTFNGFDQDYEDLRLMKNCKHFIIANSTFSWWAAWLGSNPEKIIIAPERWYLDSAIKNEDIIPDQWIKL